MNILVINCGSSSIKYQLIDTRTQKSVKSGHVERVGLDLTFAAGMERVVCALEDQSVDAIGHRVVHGGEQFSAPAFLNAPTLEAIEACSALAPLHNPRNLEGIEAARSQWPDLPQIAVFDTAFHATIPDYASQYALPSVFRCEKGLRRYGFHGTSHQYVSQQAAAFLGRPLQEMKMITAHLGNGCSITAIESGKSVDTSMGLTPLEGLIMGTRCGDIDPGLLIHLMRSEGMDLKTLDRLLNRESGLLGLSGVSSDMRELEERAAKGDPDCTLAIESFVYRARKYIGAYLAVLDGADTIVFTGGIGENSAFIRSRIAAGFSYAGIRLEQSANSKGQSGRDSEVFRISAADSAVDVVVVSTDEELMIALQAEALLTSPHY